jgi:hypothetical protein
VERQNAIATYGAKMAGTPFDLDRSLGSAAIEQLTKLDQEARERDVAPSHVEPNVTGERPPTRARSTLLFGRDLQRPRLPAMNRTNILLASRTHP